jgi:hypothetical protein
VSRLHDDAHLFTRVSSASDPAERSARRWIVPLTFRPLVAAIPIVVVLASLRWRSLDKWWSTHPTASWLLQLLLATLFALPAAEVILRYWRRRRVIAAFKAFASNLPGDSSLARLLSDVVRHDDSPVGIVVVADDADVSACVAACSISCADLDLLPVALSHDQLVAVVEADDVAAALNHLRRAFLETGTGAGLQDAQSADLWSAKASRAKAVIIGRIESTDDVFDDDEFCSLARVRLDTLRRHGFRTVLVGASRAASVVTRPVLIDTTAEHWARAYLAQPVDTTAAQSDHLGARFLLEVLGPYLADHPAVRDELEMVCRLRRATPSASSAERIEAAAAFVTMHQWSDPAGRAWLLDTLSTTTRGIDVVAAAVARHCLKIGAPGNRMLVVDAESSFVAVKRLLTVSPDLLSPDDSVSLLDGLSRTQRLDVIRSMEGADHIGLTVLAHVAAHPDLFSRFAAATKFSATVSKDDDPRLEQLLERWLSAPYEGGMDGDYSVGALGWILPSLVVRFPDAYRRIWADSVRSSAQRDPSHLQLSLARGVCLTALQFPEQTLLLVEQLVDSGVGFWLSEIKLVHAAGMAASALGLDEHHTVTSHTASEHVLVRESAELVQVGLAGNAPPATWTWGFESFETRATEWPHDPDTRRLMARVALAAGLYWNSVTRDTFEAVSSMNRSTAGAPRCITEPASGSSLLTGRCDRQCVHGMCSHTIGLTHLSENDAESGKVEFGIAFCLDQLRLAVDRPDSTEWRHLWLELASASYEHGRL